MRALAVARMALSELVERRIVQILGASVAIFIALSSWGFSRIPTFHNRNGTPVGHAAQMLAASSILTFVMFLFMFVFAMGVAFLAASAVATEVESGLALGILSRPIRRIEYIGGKWLGVCFAVLLGAIPSLALEFLVVYWTTGYAPPHPVAALASFGVFGMLVGTLALALGTRFGALVSAIVGTLGFGLEWIAGITERLGVEFGNGGLVSVTTAIGLALPTDSYWRAAQWAVQPTIISAAFNAREAYSKAGPLAGALPPTVAMMLWTALWFLAVLILAMRGFARRDL